MAAEAETLTLDSQPQQSQPEKVSVSFSIWPPTQRTRDAVLSHLIETLSAPSVLSKHYGPDLLYEHGHGYPIGIGWPVASVNEDPRKGTPGRFQRIKRSSVHDDEGEDKDHKKAIGGAFGQD
ncbi:hypothetical protein RJ640_012882 [Escallonia rubra]|uniref:WPP domain-containing protein n=1 Tax=Escallonia rubra TaxID=112253 RepID=A0AA88R8M2_9ASTE|nr:hypothetical protein RJ640_012882 [Escallonia rubra]